MEPTQGNIYVGGSEISTIDMGDLRWVIQLISQFNQHRQSLFLEGI